MRTLHLKVDGDRCSKDPSSTFVGRRTDVGQLIKIAVSFSQEWDHAIKVMTFYDANHKECTPKEIRDGVCEVPVECLKYNTFYVQVLGKKNGKILKTDTICISQIGGQHV